ncbi:MAG TPA: 50S ribosomal protein L29 [Thermodesulfobacteriota bacterium]|jgi:large subunit ribosomal protein L29|nr:50S ribosomal protein L29 [Thermodesulfobacteriota bacterium]
MKPKEIRDLSSEEMLQKEKDLTEELFNLKFQSAMGQLENTMRVKQVKKDIARVKTIFKELRKGQGK